MQKKYTRVVFIVLFSGVILYTGIQSYFYKRAVIKNSYETIAVITGIKDCYKNGRCIKYNYEYQGQKFNDEANTNWAFSNWCKSRNDCKGYKFKILLDKKHPEKNIAEWDSIFKRKLFISYPE
ncbi:hypothetical protein J8281_18780 [Aquimarina sp. U1-2]|uniref:hypothetical protein n=1 Tax=Aquimarina sp. U1-2 TaxID=2823141 RepID=UPI001AECFF95|nr:hypothetical protein [Aquimarina sp. U1-2]MBP2834249.1 hypothetical protein [Aquimarina sp. U1-2]